MNQSQTPNTTPLDLKPSIHSWSVFHQDIHSETDQFRSKILHEIKRRAALLKISLEDEDILEAGFLHQGLPSDIRAVIIQARKVLYAFASLEKVLSESKQH
jgi:hypothetical protein